MSYCGIQSYDLRVLTPGFLADDEDAGWSGEELTSDGLFTLLAFAPCGAFALTVDQSIVFWNPAAERILGFAPHEVIGRKCYEVRGGNGVCGITEQCVYGCASVRYIKAGLVPAPSRELLLRRDGERVWSLVNPMVVSGVVEGSPLLVNLFEELKTEPEDGMLSYTDQVAVRAESLVMERRPRPHAEIGHEDPGLTGREHEVLRMIASGMENPDIAEALGISLFTVRNHVRNVRQKLGAGTKLEAVLTAFRLRLVDFN